MGPFNFATSTYSFTKFLIAVEADYQRDVVWNDAKQSNLIDSIYKDYCKF